MDKDFFTTVSREEFAGLLAAFPRLPAGDVTLEKALGRYLADAVISGEDLPAASRAAMDGYAVRAADVFGAGETNPAYLDCVATLAVDAVHDGIIGPGQCAGVVTGGVMPGGADAVVMIEYAAPVGGGVIEIRRTAAPGEYVMRAGEDARAGGMALPAGTRLRAQEIGLLAALGVTGVSAVNRPRVGLISSGDEVIPHGQTPAPGQIRDVNTLALACQMAEAGAVAKSYGIVPDNAAKLSRALLLALEENDVVIISGGSSVGARDFTLEAVGGLPDAAILAHGVNMRPGKPTMLARASGKAVLGLPGQVASAQVVMLVLVLPFLRHLQGGPDAFARLWPTAHAELARNLPGSRGREDFFRVRLEDRPGRLPLAHPELGKSGLLRTMVRADALMRVAAGSEGLVAGTLVEIIRF